MLEELHVSGLGVIDDETLEFAAGLNVLTGETGAGKTMIAVALSLALGARANADLVRTGAAAAAVEARFRLDTDPTESLEGAASSDGAHDADDRWPEGDQEGELILARTVRIDGRSTARIAGRIAPVTALSSVGSRVVEIHGQHQAEPLLRPATQMAFLDRHAGAEHLDTVLMYRSVHAELRSARSRLEVLDGESREREREKDLLAYQVQDIEAAGLRLGELDALREEEPRLANAERLRELADAAERALDDERGAADTLGDAAGSLAAMAALDPTAAGLAARADVLLVDARDLAAELRAYRETAWADPGRLAAIQARIHVIKGLERKYGEGDAGILAYIDAARARLAALDGHGEERDALVTAIEGLVARATGLAARVSSGRRSAAEPLAGAISSELQQLGMPGARFEVHLDPLQEPGPDGAESVEFRFAGGPRQALLPFSKVASGGELSRTMLACRSVLADLDDVPTLVFDEVDAGIGGRAAAAVGQRLARLAESRQVLVVTHLAQIAAHADRHFRVTKEDGSTHIQALSEDDRSTELARMLSGDVSDVSLAHARELMAVGSAHRSRGPEPAGGT